MEALLIESSETAIRGQRSDLEVDRSVTVIGVSVALERHDHVAHGLHVGVIGGPWRVFGHLDAEELDIRSKGVDPLFGVLAKRLACLDRSRDGLVVDVGIVHHPVDVVTAEVLQRAAKNVDTDKRPEVADVAAGVHREPAGIHSHSVISCRRKRLLLPREGVVEAKHVGSGFYRNRAAVDEELEGSGIATNDHGDARVR